MSEKNIFLFIILILFSWGCRMFKPVEFKTADGIALEKLDCNFYCNKEKNEIFLSGKYGTFIMKPDCRTAEFNKRKIWLFSPVRYDKDGILRIEESNIEKIITPLLKRNYTIPDNAARIIIDPGHGMDDNGAVGAFSKEKDLNLSLSLKIREALEKKGFEVVMTRRDDSFLTLDARSDFAQKQQAGIFLSIHHNASENKKANGIETYSLPPGGIAATHNTIKKIPDALPGNRFDNENINLNHLIHSHLIKQLGSFDRGSKFARYKVLVNAPCPAVLIEAGFISNQQEEIEINTEERQKKCAAAIAEALCEWFKKTDD